MGHWKHQNLIFNTSASPRHRMTRNILEACYGKLPASASVSEKRFLSGSLQKTNKQKVKTKTRQFIGFPHFFFSLSFSLIQNHQPHQLFPLMTIFREFPVEKKMRSHLLQDGWVEDFKWSKPDTERQQVMWKLKINQ